MTDTAPTMTVYVVFADDPEMSTHFESVHATRESAEVWIAARQASRSTWRPHGYARRIEAYSLLHNTTQEIAKRRPGNKHLVYDKARRTIVEIDERTGDVRTLDIALSDADLD